MTSLRSKPQPSRPASLGQYAFTGVSDPGIPRFELPYKNIAINLRRYHKYDTMRFIVASCLITAVGDKSIVLFD